MAIINPLPEAPWFSIDEDAYLMYILKGYEINCVMPDCRAISFSLGGKWHRDDGPALIWSDGFEMYYLHGVGYNEENYKTEIAKLKGT